MYKNNSGFSSKFKGCSPLQLFCNLTLTKPAIGYYSYTNRWQQAEKKMRKLSLIILTLLLTSSCKETNRTENLLAKVDSLKVKNDSLTKVLNEKKPESNYWFDSENDGKKLIENGILNPAEFIENNLRRKTELIPLKAVLGGTMNYGNIQLLGSEWLIAEFDDGHVQGRGIYKYKLNSNNELEFELLNSIGPE